MAYKSLVQDLEISEPKLDRKNAQCFERHYVGEQAVYVEGLFNNGYIPYEAVRRVWFQASQHNTIGTCGMGLKVFVVCVAYDNGVNEEKMQKFMLEDASKAEAMVAAIQSKCKQK